MSAELNSERRAKFAWGFAGFMAIAVELVVVALMFHSSARFVLISLMFVLIAPVPWLAGRRILRNYSLATEGPDSETIRQNFSYRLATLVMTAYAMCMIAVSLAG